MEWRKEEEEGKSVNLGISMNRLLLLLLTNSIVFSFYDLGFLFFFQSLNESEIGVCLDWIIEKHPMCWVFFLQYFLFFVLFCLLCVGFAWSCFFLEILLSTLFKTTWISFFLHCFFSAFFYFCISTSYLDIKFIGC